MYPVILYPCGPCDQVLIAPLSEINPSFSWRSPFALVCLYTSTLSPASVGRAQLCTKDNRPAPGRLRISGQDPFSLRSGRRSLLDDKDMLFH